MSTDVMIDVLEQLQQFQNDKGVIEVVTRYKNGKKQGKFKEFFNVNIADFEEQVQEALAQTDLLNKNLLQTNKILKLQNLSFVMNGLNLCATCAGFAIMYKKLIEISEEIGQQLSRLQKQMQKQDGVWTDYEFRKIVADYNDMLDCRRKQKPYSEKALRLLVDQEYNMLRLLLDVLKKDISGDHRATIEAIFSLLSMYTQTLMFFDETYYFNNCEVLQGQDVWHSSHVKWESVFDELASPWFEKFLQDYAVFETDLDTKGVDVFYLTLEEQVTDLKQNLLSNQELIAAIGNQDELKTVKEAINQQIRTELEEDIRGVFEGNDAPEMQAARDELLKAVATA